MKIKKNEINQIMEWKNQIKKIRHMLCPFGVSREGGEICAKAFKKCNLSLSDAKDIYITYYLTCHTKPCPCEIYTFNFVMMQANRIIKYGRI